MRSRYVLLLSALIFCTVAGSAQNAETSVQGRNILTQLLNTSGYTSNTIPGFTATGTISYFGGNSKQVANVSVRARGYDQFRMDASMPTGTRTVSLDRNGGRRKEPNGRTTDLPAHSMLVSINPVVPYMELANALAKPDYAVSYQGQASENGKQYHQVRVRRIITRQQDPTGLVEDLTQADYFIDLQTMQVARIVSTVAATTNVGERFPQVIEFENYVAKAGIAIPSTVRLKVSGSTMWEMQITNLQATNALTDTDFSVQ